VEFGDFQPAVAMELREKFGLNVRRSRKAKGMTIEGLAHHSELSYSYVGEIERGLRNPTLDVVESLAKGLGIDVARLFES
jgi:transcriptional regulator with XRE-family HTH domain